MNISSAYVFGKQISPGEVPSPFASRKKILEWIEADGADYAKNFSFECPSVIYIRAQGGWQYNVFDTKFKEQTQAYRKTRTYVIFDETSTEATNTFEGKTNDTPGAFITYCDGNWDDGFMFDSAINGTAQRNWRTRPAVQANDGHNGNDTIYGIPKVNAPVFEAVADAQEYLTVLNAYFDDPNATTWAALKEYMDTNTKMLNP